MFFITYIDRISMFIIKNYFQRKALNLYSQFESFTTSDLHTLKHEISDAH